MFGKEKGYLTMSLEKVSKELFLVILESLDKKLEENRLELTLNLYGETVMMACFDARPATKDVDAIFETSPIIDNILADIAETYGLHKGWINQDIKEPLKNLKQENLKEIYKFKNLKVLAPSAEQMLAMKILSARPEPVEEVDVLWKSLSEGGRTSQKITTNLLFSGDACGRTEEAVNYYTKLFPDSCISFFSKYEEGEAKSSKAVVNYAAFKLCGVEFSAMDNAYNVEFGFNEAFSLMVQCGWLKDRFGVSWQIVPACMNEMMSNGSKEQIQRVTDAFLKMKKFDIAGLKRTYNTLTIETIVNEDMEHVWTFWTEPRHIMEWNNASEDWHTPSAENDLRVGGTFTYKMAAKDGSLSFDFSGVYDEVKYGKRIAYTLGDGRKVVINFLELDGGVKVIETFEAEETHSLEMQRGGWQAILENFKHYADTRNAVGATSGGSTTPR